MPEMDLTDFRADLTQVVEDLASTGPVRLLKYGLAVAEIRPIDAQSVRKETERWRTAIERLAEAEVPHLFDLLPRGIDDVEALLARFDDLTAHGATFAEYPEHSLPDGEDEGTYTVDDLLARWYFGDAYPKTAPALPWFEALVDIQRMAHERGLDSRLPEYESWDEDSTSFVDNAVAAGHTPDSLRQFADQTLDTGVPLHRLDDLLGKDSIPTDVAAMKDFDRYWFDNLVKDGLPHIEAVEVFRRGIDPQVAGEFASAGATTVQTIQSALHYGIDPKMAMRASRDGLTCDEWMDQLQEIKHLRYAGGGALPVPLLVQAVREKVSLVRWDSTNFPVSKRDTDFSDSREKRMNMYPWSSIVPNHVLDLARAGVTVTLASEFGTLMRHTFKDGNPQEFASTLTAAVERGLTVDIAKAMRRQDAKTKPFHPSPADLIAILEEGVTPEQAGHLIETLDQPAQWVDYLQERRARQHQTDSFLDTHRDSAAWNAAISFATTPRQSAYSRRQVTQHRRLHEAMTRIQDEQPLNDDNVQTLLTYTHEALAGHRMAVSISPNGFQEQFADVKEEVAKLSHDFSALWQDGADEPNA
jgi:antitoxin (DNA-binding transcriptional repressor) of toxin-antitoxin stability system